MRWRRGLVGLFVMYKSHGVKGLADRISVHLFLFLAKKSCKTTKVSLKSRDARIRKQERKN